MFGTFFTRYIKQELPDWLSITIFLEINSTNGLQYSIAIYTFK